MYAQWSLYFPFAVLTFSWWYFLACVHAHGQDLFVGGWFLRTIRSCSRTEATANWWRVRRAIRWLSSKEYEVSGEWWESCGQREKIQWEDMNGNHTNTQNRYVCVGEAKFILSTSGANFLVMMNSSICSFSWSRSVRGKMNPKSHAHVFLHEHQDEMMISKKESLYG